MHCLVTGATGYVGRRLVPALLAAGHTVRCLARNPAKLRAEPWADAVQHRTGDVLDDADLAAALDGVDTFYYLVHSLSDNGFRHTDRRAAQASAAAADRAGVRRLVYLSGLGEQNGELSAHLNSRTEVGEIFLDARTPAIVLRAGLIVGAGSTSFELLRHLMQRVPVITAAPWLDVRSQPVAITDVLHYLVGAAGLPAELNRTFDIGGPDVLSYRDMMHGFAEATGITAPVLVPAPMPPTALTAWLASMLAPVDEQLAYQLIESLEHEMVCTEQDLDALLDHQPMSYVDAVREAARNVPPTGTVATTGHAAWPAGTDPPGSGGPMHLIDGEHRSSAAPESLWSVIKTIGGEHGWYTRPLVLQAHATAQRLLGDDTAVRGRTNPEQLRAGQAVDWWRVHSVTPGRSVLLQSALRLPGEMWLELSVRPDGQASRYRQRLFFAPQGSAGYAYWYAARPLHELSFEVMARNIVRTAEHRGSFGTPAIAAAAVAAHNAQRALGGALRLLNRQLRG